MSFLTINGAALPVKNASPSDGFEDAGEQVRAYAGNLLRDNIYSKIPINFETTPLNFIDWFRWVQLLRGEGDVWHFDEAGAYEWSSKGVGNQTESGTIAETVTAKYGGRAIDISAASSVSWDNVLDASGNWTALVWRDNGVGGYKHYAETSGGLYQLDGISVGGSEGWFTTISVGTGFKLQNTGGSAVKFDDLVIMPFDAPTEWLQAFHTTHAIQAWTNLPTVLVQGDIFGAGSLEVQLQNSSIRDKFIQAAVDGSWNNALRNLSGRLVQV